MFKFKYILFILIQCSWGCWQTLAGFFVFLRYLKSPHAFYHGAVETQWSLNSGMSLGLFVFTPAGSEHDRILAHEYGHSRQSLLLGPLYIIPALSSVIWANMPYFKKKRSSRGLSYYSCWQERWADRWGV